MTENSRRPAPRRWTAAALCAALAAAAPGPLAAQAAARIAASAGLGSAADGAAGAALGSTGAHAGDGLAWRTGALKVTPTGPLGGAMIPTLLAVAVAPVPKIQAAAVARSAFAGDVSVVAPVSAQGRSAGETQTQASAAAALKAFGLDQPFSAVLAARVLSFFDGSRAAYGREPLIPPSSAERPARQERAQVPSPDDKAPAPFVPAIKKMGDLERLAQADAEAGWTAAQAILRDNGERRQEVRIAAMRILERLPPERFVTLGLELLTSFNTPAELILKELGRGHNWYLQRLVLKALGTMAADTTPRRAEIIAALQAAYQDHSAPVRLTAQWALTRYGVDPGPEADLHSNLHDIDSLRDQPGPDRRPDPRKSKWSRLWLALFLGAVLTVIIGPSLIYTMTSNQTVATQAVNTHANPPAADAQPAPEKAATQVPDQAADPITTVTPSGDAKLDALNRIAENTRVAAEAQKKIAAVSEKEALARAKGGGFNGKIMTILMWVGIMFGLSWLIRRMGAGVNGKGGIGKGGRVNPSTFAKAGKNVEKSDVRFSDVAGIDEARVEVEEILDFLRNPRRYRKMGAEVPKGVLLEGPPGTGKTLMARALAGEVNAGFIHISGSDFIEIYVGLGASRVRDLFEQARANAPCIIFIDEIDAVGEARDNSSGLGGGHDERKQTINALLKSMDGFDNTDGVIVLAATNRVQSLDPALTRPGRFDRTVHVGLPDVRGREAILEVHGSNARLGHDVDLRYIARRTTGLGGAYLANIINEAALLAVRRGADHIEKQDADEAVDRATIGAKRTLFLSDEIKLRIARHETGHVLGNLLGARPSPINKVTIIPHGTGALGFAEPGSEDDKHLETRSEMEARLVSIMGGMVMEEAYYGESSTGPGSDLEQAEHIARVMVERLGMGRRSGLGASGPDRSTPLAARRVSEATARKIDLDVKELKEAAKAKAAEILNRKKNLVDKMVARLMEKETLTRDEIEEIVRPN